MKHPTAADTFGLLAPLDAHDQLRGKRMIAAADKLHLVIRTETGEPRPRSRPWRRPRSKSEHRDDPGGANGR
jgi:hypothetical protein